MGVGLPPQGYFWWPGIDTFLHGSFSFTHGITPSLCQIYIAPQLVWPAMTGVLNVNYLPGGASYFFTDCILDFISIEREGDGRQVWGLHILDRRWKWVDCGRISGTYNIRRQNGDGDEEIFQPSAKVLKDLMQLCLSAMGEDDYGYDLSQVTENAFPEIEWDYENPSQALLELCDKFSYRVVLTLNNQVLVAKANQGSYLPDFQYLSGATTINPPNTPASIVVAAGKTVVQADWRLVAMAIETDNTLVPLNTVSYKPQTTNGWGDIDLPDFDKIADPVARAYAIKSVFKYYQISPGLELEGLDENNPENDTIDNIMRVLPLLDTQLVKTGPSLQPENEDTEIPQYTTNEPLPAWVYGRYQTLESVSTNATAEIDSSISTPDQTQGFYPSPPGYTIDGQRGLVIFDDYTFANPVDQITGEVTDKKFKVPATLYLRTSCNVRDAKTMGWLRYETKFDMQDAGLQTQPTYVKADDIALKLQFVFTGEGEVDGVISNEPQVVAQADYVLQAELAKLQIEDPQSFEYPGFVFLNLDGAIQQITWNVGDDGKATTQCNRCKEDLVNTQSYEEAKQNALLQKALANRAKTSSVLKQHAGQSLTVSSLGPNVSK